MILTILIVLLSGLSLTLKAQPDNRWVHFYDGHELSDYLSDVFTAADDEYALAGYTLTDSGSGFWLVKTDEDGGELWQHTYLDEQYPGINNWCYTVIQNDDGGFLLGGRCRDENDQGVFTVL